jgi:DNA replication protein DnaC
MLTHPTVDKLTRMGLTGMACALQEQLQMAEIGSVSFEERLGLLVDREMTERENRRLKTRLRKAKLRQSACVEDIDYRYPRGLDRARLPSCRAANGSASITTC